MYRPVYLGLNSFISPRWHGDRLIKNRSRTPAFAVVGNRQSACAAGKIDLIITDVDGTLLNSRQELTSGVRMAIEEAHDAGVPLMVATGKAVGPWTKRILPQLPGRMPQIFLQGLYIREPDGNPFHVRLLPQDVRADALQLAKEFDLSFVMYSHDRIVTAQRDTHTDRLIFYGEPTPEEIGMNELERSVEAMPIHKVMFMGSEEDIARSRPSIAHVLGDRSSLTTAIAGMLEILPHGASKGAGVSIVLEQLGIPPERCLAIGDGENDIEMLQLVGVGVAVGNAGAATKNAADLVVGSNDEDGVAQAIRTLVLDG